MQQQKTWYHPCSSQRSPRSILETCLNILKHSAMHLNFTRCSKASKTSELIRFWNTCILIPGYIMSIRARVWVRRQLRHTKTYRRSAKPQNRRHVHPTIQMKPGDMLIVADMPPTNRLWTGKTVRGLLCKYKKLQTLRCKIPLILAQAHVTVTQFNNEDLHTYMILHVRFNCPSPSL